MRIQSTMFLILALTTFSSVCVSQHRLSVEELSNSLGGGVKTITANGTMSARGSQQFSGLPITFTLSNDSVFCMTVGGPFGMTAARMYSQPDTFVIVNYLMRDAVCGNPLSADLSTLIPVRLTVTDLARVMQGRIPGDVSRFSISNNRDNHTVLLSYVTDSLSEHILIDTAINVMKQYQRKRKGGITEMNVSFGDVRVVSGINIPFGIDVEVDNNTQSLSVRLNDVVVNDPVELPTVFIPPSFSKTVYR